MEISNYFYCLKWLVFSIISSIYLNSEKSRRTLVKFNNYILYKCLLNFTVIVLMFFYN